MSAAPPVSFLVSRFPNPSETFIQAQIQGLIERGSEVQVTALAEGEAEPLSALRAAWGDKFRVRFVSVPKSYLARLAIAPGALLRSGGSGALDAARFGEDAASLRLLVAMARWPAGAQQRRVWLAHYGRWGRFACALRDLGRIAGPIATVFHGKDMSAYLRKSPDAYRTLFQRGDLHLPISETWRTKLIALGAPEQKTLVHRMGVDTSRFTATTRTLAAGEALRFIGVGRMVEKKGFDDAIAAFARFRSLEGAPPAHLTLIGDGPLRGALQALASRHHLGEAIRFAGLLRHDRVAAELAAAHIFVLPSKTARSGDMEGIPVSLMEAMALGMPVLATRHSGTPELVEHGVSGLLCAEGDSDALAANMLQLARRPARWAEMGAAGAAKVRAEFDLKTWNDRLFERLSKLYTDTP